MNNWKRVVQFDRGVVEAGGYLYAGILWLLIAAVLLGASILVNHFVSGGGNTAP